MKTSVVIASTFASVAILCQASPALAAPDVSGKVVLANLDRYDAILRFGKTRRDIKPKKASVLSPRKYPVTIEYWSGNTKSGWKKQSIPAAGLYGLNFKRGSWTLAKLPSGKTARPAKPVPKQVLQKRIVQRPARRLPINADRNRWSPLARAAWFAGSIYQFVRDEKDRDLLRELLIRGRDEDLKDFERWIDASDAIALPHKKELKEAYDDLARLSDQDWKEIETADENDWNLAKSEVGDLISADEWQNLTSDFADINTKEFWQDNVEVDLNDLDFADNLDSTGDIDIGDDLDLSENVDVGDLDIGTETHDLSGYDDFDGFDGAADVDPGDFGGGSLGDDDFGDFGGGDDFDF